MLDTHGEVGRLEVKIEKVAPFDRPLAAHSAARRTPLCATDHIIRRNHRYVPPELSL